MRNKIGIRLPICAFAILALLLPAFAQAQKDHLATLQKQRDHLNAEIETVNKLLGEAQQEKTKSFNELKLLVRKMELSQTKVAHLRSELQVTGKEITRATSTIVALEDEIRDIQAEFSRLANAVYLGMHPHSESFYFLSSASLTEGYYEILYFREFADYLRRQIKLIRRTRKYLAEEREYLDVVKTEKEKLSVEEESEMDNLKKSKKEKDEVYKKLKKREDEYKKSHKEKVNALMAINEDIKKELERISRANSSQGEILLPLSKEFKENKGKLPWPIPAHNGVITTHFGRQLYEGSDVEVDINGIDITTGKNQPIMAVFKGKVEMVRKVPMHGNLIIISHGSYFTLYSNVETAYVKKGDEISALQEIGVARTDKTSGETVVHFELFNGTTPMNPEEWISRK